MRPHLVLLALGLLLAPAPLAGQAGGAPAPDDRARGRHGPVELLLQNQADLALTRDQVVRLEAIQRRMDQRNRPLVERMMTIRREIRQYTAAAPQGTDPQASPETQQRVEEARALMRQIRENNRAAMKEVGGVLTEEQKVRVRTLIRAQEERRGTHGQRPGRRG
jgi:hypothetical protein